MEESNNTVSPSELQDHQHHDTPKDALVRALAECEIKGMDEVLIIYNTEDGKSGSFDSNLTAAEAGFLCDLFKHWLINSCLGALQGGKAEAIEKAVTGEET